MNLNNSSHYFLSLYTNRLFFDLSLVVKLQLQRHMANTKTSLFQYWGCIFELINGSPESKWNSKEKGYLASSFRIMVTNHSNTCSPLGLGGSHSTFTHFNSFYLQSTGVLLCLCKRKREIGEWRRKWHLRMWKVKRKGEFLKVIQEKWKEFFYDMYSSRCFMSLAPFVIITP